MIKKIIILLLFVIYSTTTFSQNFYEVKFKADDVNYTSFITYYSKDKINVRTAYKSNGNYKVAEYDCTGKFMNDKYGNKYFVFDGANAKVVYFAKQDNLGYNADNFIFTKLDEKNVFKNLYVIDDHEISDISGYVNNSFFNNAYKATFRELNPKNDFTDKYIYKFYEKDESKYSTLTSLHNTSSTDEDPYVSTDEVTIHLILVADTNDENIGTSTTQDLNALSYLFTKIFKELGVKYSIKKIYGDNLTATDISNEIYYMNNSTNDVVMLYYSGHGYNDTSKSSVFPTMNLNDVDYSLESVFYDLRKNQARLTIVIGDLCNSISRRSRNKAGEKEGLPFKSGYQLDKNKLSKLFLKARGYVLSTSSKKGEWSFCSITPYGEQGKGQFTKSFISSFIEETSKFNNKPASWNSIFNRAYKSVERNTNTTVNQNGYYGQHGFNKINIYY